jgi:beta-glucosidase
VLELKGFERVTLAPGESKTVRFTLTPAQLAYFDRAMNEVNGPGPVTVHVGNSSANLKSADFAVA